MELSLKQIADALRISSDSGWDKIKIVNISSIETAKEGHISFLADSAYERFIYTTEATAVIVDKSFSPQKAVRAKLLKVDKVRAALQQVLSLYEKENTRKGEKRESPIFIGENVTIGKDIYIGAFAYIDEGSRIGNATQIYPQVYIGKNVTIGEGCIIHAGAKIYDNTIIGNEVEIDFGAVIGSRGFGYVGNGSGAYIGVPQVGNVVLEDHVYIGANTTVDRSTMESTIVHYGSKIDNLVQLGHNTTIGKNVIICGQVGIAGSTKIGDRAILAGQVGVADHLIIEEGIICTAKSGVPNSLLDKNVVYSGIPAMHRREHLQERAMLRKMPELQRRVELLEKKSP